MHLPDRSRGQRLRVESSKDLFYRPDLFSYHSFDLVHRHRCHLILQPFQLGDKFRRQYIGAGAEHLPKLDIGRPKLHKGMGQFVRHAIVRFQLAGAHRIQCGQGDIFLHPHALDQIAQPVFNQHPGNLAITDKMSYMASNSHFPSPSVNFLIMVPEPSWLIAVNKRR